MFVKKLLYPNNVVSGVRIKLRLLNATGGLLRIRQEYR
jgi:hypothetical protein